MLQRILTNQINLQPEQFDPYSSLSYKSNKTKTNNQEHQLEYHAYDNFINPQRTTHDIKGFSPQPRKHYRLFLREKMGLRPQ